MPTYIVTTCVQRLKNTIGLIRETNLNTPVGYRTAFISVAAFLTGIGLLCIYASSSIPGALRAGDQFHFVSKQALAVLVGFVIIFVMGHLPFRMIEKATFPLMVLSIFLLCLVQLPGLSHTAKGATRWISFPGFTIQPSEFSKLALVLFLAKVQSTPKSNFQNFWSGVFPTVATTGILCALLLLQPDFGSAAVLLILGFSMAIISGLPRRHFFVVLCSGAVAFAIAIISAPYRLQRLLVFLNPWQQTQSGGFQIIQSYLGFQNGGLWGVGLGESRQKLFFLPEAHTDFILSVLGEELGLSGVTMVCLAFLYLVYLGSKISLAQYSTYRAQLAFGLTALLGLQAFLNMAVAMGMLPTKGMTLPFLSNGANSIFVFLLVIGILARIGQEVPQRRDLGVIFG